MKKKRGENSGGEGGEREARTWCLAEGLDTRRNDGGDLF